MMNCPNCGHPHTQHFLVGSACSGCSGSNICRKSQQQVIIDAQDAEIKRLEAEAKLAEYEAYREEALIARELLRDVAMHLSGTSIPASRNWKSYLEARAKTKKLES